MDQNRFFARPYAEKHSGGGVTNCIKNVYEITSSGEFANEEIASAYSLIRFYYYNNDGQPTKITEQVTRERWRDFRRRMCILRHLSAQGYLRLATKTGIQLC